MKKYMPFNGLRWSRDSGSALYDIPQTAVFGRAGGGKGDYVLFTLLPLRKCKVKQLPFPGSLSTETEPPILSIRLLT